MPLEIEEFVNRTVGPLKKMQEDYQKALQDGAAKLLQDIFVQAFAEFPEIQAFGWTQYTPYFNDGEPCVFGRHEICLTFDPVIKGEYGVEWADQGDKDDIGSIDGYGDKREGWLGEYTFRDWKKDEAGQVIYVEVDDPNDWRKRKPIPEFKTERDESLYNLLKSLESIPNDIYEGLGDHIRVIVTRDGFDISDYYHD